MTFALYSVYSPGLSIVLSNASALLTPYESWSSASFKFGNTVEATHSLPMYLSVSVSWLYCPRLPGTGTFLVHSFLIASSNSDVTALISQATALPLLLNLLDATYFTTSHGNYYWYKI